MHKYIKLIHVLLAVIFICSCETEGTDPQFEEKLVVEGYLYKQEPVQSVKLTSLVPFTSEDQNPLPVTDATVSLIRDNVAFGLIPLAEKPGTYYYPSGDLQVQSGDHYKLQINWKGQIIDAETVIPASPDNMQISASQLKVETFENLIDWLRSGGVFPSLQLTWHNPDGNYYYVVVDNIDPNPENIEYGWNFEGNFSYVSPPTQADAFIIQQLSLKQYGRHRIRLYRVSREYADLYENLQQDSRNLNEPATNIKNGLGIFTAFAADSLFFNVVK